MIDSGSRIGPYEITGALGAGGMGEVYRARDTRLARDVAIKVLPATLASDPDRLQRFEQEARAAAGLNHPNILAVHDVGRHEHTPFIVSELLEGETLRDRLRPGALPVRRAIDFAIQVAHGLAAAHEKGIVHRDLKPENLFVTAEGRVKILDFGLAKLTQADAALSGASIAPTVVPDTLPGVVLGTLGYMAPEQVRGLAADHRADIFAFGVILYEMLTGRRAFSRETTADTMTAILREDLPDVVVADRQVPPALERIVDRCVEKSPSSRFQSAKDLGFALEGLSSPSGPAAAVDVRHTIPPREKLAWALAAVLALTSVGALAQAYLRGTPATLEPLKYFVTLPHGTEFTAVPIAPFPAMSPDGRRLAFVAQREGTPRQELWVLELGSTDPRPVAGTMGGRLPFWSADSQWVGFELDGTLMKVDPRGGAPLPITSVSETGFEGASWNREGIILFGSTTSGLFQVSQGGGSPRPATTLDSAKSETSHRQPHFLPDGRRFLYLAQAPNMVYLGSLDGGPPKELLMAESKAMYSATGHVLFVRSGRLLARPFDARRETFTGEEFLVADDIRAVAGNGRAAFSASDTGVLAYREGSVGNVLRLSWVDSTGKVITTLDEGLFRGVSQAVDGRIAWHLHEETDGGRIWARDEARRTTYPLTFRGHTNAPVWSPDASFIAYSMQSSITEVRPPGAPAGTDATDGLYRVRTDGTGEPEQLLKEAAIPSDWTGDDSIVFERQDPKTGWDLWRLALSGDRKPVPLYFNTPFDERHARVSPNGRWIAYSSNESRTTQVYVRSLVTPGGKQQISTNGGNWPLWSRDGTKLFFLQGRELQAVPVRLDANTFEWDAPSRLFEIVSQQFVGVPNFAPAFDGKRFLVAAIADDRPEAPLTIAHNWLEAATR
jgi:Tol biopolymer transport system component